MKIVKLYRVRLLARLRHWVKLLLGRADLYAKVRIAS